MKRILLTGAILSLLNVAVYADLFGFEVITTNTPFGNAVAGQLFMDATEINDTSSSVVFTNAGPLDSTIKSIYFGSNETNLMIDVTAILGQSLGVDFSLNVAKPSEPPASDDFGNWWYVTLESIGATPPPAQNGIDPGEYLDLEVTYSDTGLNFCELLDLGQLGVALHVISIEGGGSETFVNLGDAIPEPSSAVLVCVVSSLGLLIRRRFVI